MALSSDGDTALVGGDERQQRRGGGVGVHALGGDLDPAGRKARRHRRRRRRQPGLERGAVVRREHRARSAAPTTTGRARARCGCSRARGRPGPSRGRSSSAPARPATGAPGLSVALSADGTTALVGGPGDNGGAGRRGCSRARGRPGPSRAQSSSAAARGGDFGTSVALSDDGDTPCRRPRRQRRVGAAWVFTRSGTTWTQQGPKLVGSGAVGHAYQGTSVALSSDGNTALVGGPGDNGYVGAAWVFTRSGTTWTQQGSKLVGTGAGGTADQGYSVALSGDGSTALVGGDGATRTARGGVGVHALGDDLDPAGVKARRHRRSRPRQQGYSVALSGDGDTALVGGFGDNGGVGAAWVFVTQLPPGTKITKAKISSKHHQATFSFKAIDAATGFQCALVRNRRRTTRSPSRRSKRAGRRRPTGTSSPANTRSRCARSTPPAPTRRRRRRASRSADPREAQAPSHLRPPIARRVNQPVAGQPHKCWPRGSTSALPAGRLASVVVRSGSAPHAPQSRGARRLVSSCRRSRRDDRNATRTHSSTPQRWAIAFGPEISAQQRAAMLLLVRQSSHGAGVIASGVKRQRPVNRAGRGAIDH